jgi:hydroxymethylpyrimidine/phosphomethylpyrimidine kinase
LITPNIPEAETLTGIGITSEDDMGKAAHKLRKMGACAVLIKGGHLKKKLEASGQKAEGRRQQAEKARANFQAIEVLDDGGKVTVLRGEWIDSPPVRGTGCMLSSAIAAGLGLGMDLNASVSSAQRFVAEMIRCAPQLGLIRSPITQL